MIPNHDDIQRAIERARQAGPTLGGAFGEECEESAVEHFVSDEWLAGDDSDDDDDSKRCEECDEPLDDCECDRCEDCGELDDDCECECDECGEFRTDCTCEE
jgi:hypothetical protein